MLIDGGKPMRRNKWKKAGVIALSAAFVGSFSLMAVSTEISAFASTKDVAVTEYDEAAMQSVRIPHTVKELPFHYFDEHAYQMVSGYRRHLFAKKEWKGKVVRLTFEGVAHDSEVYVNGKKAGAHHCGYTAFTIDISALLHYGEDNVIAVRVDSNENLNVPPFGFVIDYMTYGGIYRDVYLEINEESYLADVFLKPQVELETKRGTLLSEITLAGGKDNLLLRQYIRRKGEEEYRLIGEETFSEIPAQEGKKTLAFPAGIVSLWEVENPALYEVKTQLVTGNNIIDEVITTVGFRQAVFQKDGFYLNGRKLRIRGLNRHQSYPYVGYAMPASIQRMDAEVLKKELGLNAVRTSHYPQSQEFINSCDELGLMVFTEIPGWQQIGDEAWKAQAVENVKDMVTQYRNHPSIILWGVRINESQDDDEFYRRTNAMAHKLDDTRQTGGVRAHKKSSLLEDVYTYNDFVHNGLNKGCEHKKDVTSDIEKPYLITEYNGHMYSTKAFDWEEHRMWHALRHASVLDAVAGEEDIAGSFGWCMADYNTHKDFGSGDRICYHGVLDMFRNPKMAADVYACQQEERPVLDLSSTMDIGEHPACNRGETYIFTNADSVRMYKNDRFIKEYKKTDSPYKNLKHGPIPIDDYIGNAIEEGEHFTPKQAAMVKEVLNLAARYGMNHLPKRAYYLAAKLMLFYHMKMEDAVALYNKYVGDWGGQSMVYKLEAIKDGKVVKTLVREPVQKVLYQITASSRKLRETHTYDVAAVRIQAVDENGNLLPYFQEPVQLKCEGALELIGPDIISLQGGMGGTYVKTIGKIGSGKLMISNRQAGTKEITFEIE